MLVNFNKIVFVLILGIIFSGCREEYISPVNPESQRLLVVEGFLQTMSGEPTVINLSRTVRLVDSISYLPETGANVYVESDNGSIYYLQPTVPGSYQAHNLPLNIQNQYRLRIETSNGSSYASEFVPVVYSPPIDSVTWIKENNDLKINVSTHNDGNDTRYYRWDYVETWETHSGFYSEYFYDKVSRNMYERDWFESQQLYFCWKTRPSTEILLTSTAKQAEDVVRNFKVKDIFRGDERLSVRYHILVKQYGLTKEAFDYWQTLKKNTEGMGSIFDPQPSVNNSNIKNMNNPNEIVIGYISAGNTSTRTKFINRNEVDWNYRLFCEEILVLNRADSLDLNFKDGSLIPTYAILSPAGSITHFSSSTAPCVDCRLTGSPIKPSFW